MAAADRDPILDILQERAHLHDWTSEELVRLKGLSDDNLLRAGGNTDAFAIVESSRRLRNALQKEERAIKRLTRWLLVFTIAIFALTIVLVVHPERGSNTEASVAAGIYSYFTTDSLGIAVLGAFIAVILSIPVAWFFYRIASRELRNAAKELHAETEAARLVSMHLRYMLMEYIARTTSVLHNIPQWADGVVSTEPRVGALHSLTRGSED